MPDPTVSQNVSRRWTLYDQGEGFPMWTISHGQEMPAYEHAELVEVMPVAEYDATVERLRLALAHIAGWKPGRENRTWREIAEEALDA